MPNQPFEASFMIDFNLHQVPAAVGLEVSARAGAAIVGNSEDQFLAYISNLKSQVRADAQRLLENPNLAQALEQLELSEGGTVITIGESITTYRRGYAELLGAMLELQFPEHRLRFLNVGQSGYTSTHGKELVFTQLLRLEPDLVTIKFGANDTKHFGGSTQPMLVSLEEYRQNIDSMVRGFQAHTRARIVLIAPAPIVEQVVNSSADYQAMHMTWDNADLRALGVILHEIAEHRQVSFVDFYSSLGDPPDPRLFLADGLHPGPNGHELMLNSLLLSLAHSQMTSKQGKTS